VSKKNLAINELLKTSKGRQKIGASIVQPLRGFMTQGLSRQLFTVEECSYATPMPADRTPLEPQEETYYPTLSQEIAALLV